MPMGMADLAVVLWSRFLVVDPDAPEWPDRDRFVLSNGHGSMLLYSLLHLAGFPLTLDDIRNFRQWDSPTAGHPEREPHLGIEMTTGPLGQGFGTGVGMAMAEAHLRARLGEEVVNHRTYGFVSDGDLMEGISSETSSLAGHLQLGRLIYFYDDNDISIDGSTDIAFSEDIAKRFEAVGWHTLAVDGHDRQAIAQATDAALADQRPSLVIARTHIGHGSPNQQDTAGVHGKPMGDEEIALTKTAMGWPTDVEFHVPDEVKAFFSQAMQRGRKAHAAWSSRLATGLQDPEFSTLWNDYFASQPVHLEAPDFGDSLATRAVNGKIFDQMGEKAPGLIGGAADLVGSTKTELSSTGLFSADDRAARNIAFGVREHAMATIVNGMAVHGGLRPYGATFFVFSDYMRPAVRLGALMSAPSIWVWTHDSIFLGEDGPTHQPIEHLASLRAMPNLVVLRPADAHETVAAWEIALNRTDGPTALILTRQSVPTLPDAGGSVARGAYVVRAGTDVVLVATGSEVATALEAAEVLAGEDISARVVSMPSWELFELQSPEYQAEVLGTGLPRASIEAGSTFGWERIVGIEGLTIGLDRFGASAPAPVLAEQFGFTGEAIADRVANWLR